MSGPSCPTERVVLAVEDVTYAVRGRALVARASLALHPGRLTLVIGPNGAGKSTLFKLLGGLLKPSNGRSTSLGTTLACIPPWRLACRRAVMAQSSSLAMPFRVHDLVRIGLEGIGSAREADHLVEQALSRADALHLADRDGLTLSGGEQQRVHFARALCQLAAGQKLEPVQALLLDEPTASLDLCHQIALMDTARELAHRQGMAVLAIVHDLNLAGAYADTLVAMDQGRIIAQGAPETVLDAGLLERTFRLRRRLITPGAARFAPVLPQLFEPA